VVALDWHGPGGRQPFQHVLPLDIKARPVEAIAAKDCVLFLWSTIPMFIAAHEVMRTGDSSTKVTSSGRSPTWGLAIGSGKSTRF
jgi:N6-adenosine-specific RNA methylase IME4